MRHVITLDHYSRSRVDCCLILISQMYRQPMKSRTYFLGAGFSKALNPAYPTLAELSAAVVSSFQSRYPIGAIREHFDQLPKGFDKDIEQLLTYLYSDWPWKASVESDLDKALYKAFVYEIAAALEEIPMSAIPDEFRMFIHFLRCLDHNRIISLNYDNLIERYRYPESFSRSSIGFGELELQVEEVFMSDRKTSVQSPWVVENKKSAPDKPKRLMLVAREWLSQVTLEDFRVAVTAASPVPLNANGVFDWVPHAYKELHEVENFYPVARQASKYLLPNMDPRQFEGSTGKVIHLHGSIDWRGDAMGPTIRLADGSGPGRLEKLPAIVPPVMDKSHHYAAGRFRDQWIKAHSEIQHSQEVVIVGFSFPPTDISCQFLFKSAVMPGTRVVVVNRDESLRGRYISVFGDIKDVKLDFTFTGRDDALMCYIKKEVLMAA